MKKSLVTMLALGLLAFFLSAVSAGAGEFPKKPIKWVYPWKAGTPGYILGQMVTKRMGDVLGKKMITTAMPGGGGVKSARSVLSKRADGYTVFDAWVANLVFAVLARPNVGYTYESFSPLGKVAIMPLTLMVKGDAPYSDLKSFIEYARKNPGLSYACSPERSVPHAVFASFLRQAGVKARGVPYPGIGAGAKDLLGGTVDFAVGNFPLIKIYGDKLKTLCVFMEERSPLYPNIPTAKELGMDPGFGNVGMGWNGYVVKKGTPSDRLEKLRSALKEVMTDEKFKAGALKLGYILDYTSPEAFNELAAESMKRLKRGLEDIAWEKRQFSK